MKHTCYTACHCGGLKECLKTEQPISYELAYDLVKFGIYEYYSYDERIKAHRYILKNHYLNIGLPTWLHYYGLRKIDI